MANGVLAINVTPDGHGVAILTRDFRVLIHDKVKEKTYSVSKMDDIYLQSQHVETMFEQLKSNKGNESLDRFTIFVSNELSHIYVVSESQRVVASWTKLFEGDIPDPNTRKSSSNANHPSQSRAVASSSSTPANR